MKKRKYLLVESNSTDVYFNLALEYYLSTEKTFPDSTVILIWRTTPTVMIGKSQNTYGEMNDDYITRKKINVVRRKSVGGTVYADLGVWQYSFITLDDGFLSLEKSTIPIVNALKKKIGLNAKFIGKNDISVNNKKVSMNTQYKSGNFVVHHGTLLCCTDLDAIARSTDMKSDILVSKGIQSTKEKLGNIFDLLEKEMSMEEFKNSLIDYFIDEKSSVITLNYMDMQRVNEIAEDHFKNSSIIYEDWTAS